MLRRVVGVALDIRRNKHWDEGNLARAGAVAPRANQSETETSASVPAQTSRCPEHY